MVAMLLLSLVPAEGVIVEEPLNEVHCTYESDKRTGRSVATVCLRCAGQRVQKTIEMPGTREEAGGGAGPSPWVRSIRRQQYRSSCRKSRASLRSR